MLGTLLGVRLSRFVPGTTQLVIFAAVMLTAAVFMLRGRAPSEEDCAQVDWTAMAFVAAGTLPGIALGGYLHHFVPQSLLRRGFAAFLVIMATFIFIEHLGSLSPLSRGR